MNDQEQYTHKPGIYFDMPFHEYLAIPALSNSGIKNLIISRMDFWANSWMNPNPPKEREAKHFLDGRAYHARICEGAEAFDSRYMAEFDPSKYPDALLKTDEIKSQLRNYKADGYDVKLTGNKPELIERLYDINPQIQVIDSLKKQYAASWQGYEFIDLDTFGQIGLAAAMIDNHPELSKCFQGGYSEVTILWFDEAYNIPMKARFDFLKLQAIVDLKTFANQMGKPIDRAIYSDIAANKYHIQAAVYCKAVEEAKKLAADGKVNGEHDSAWLEKFIAAPPPQFVFVFQQKGIAPLARGKIFKKGLVYECGIAAIRDAMEEYTLCMERFGDDGTPWVDTSPIESLDDEGFPAWIAEA